ncbi:MAG: DUF4430 domain-containing protein [Clostridia bacterium]|nr:DUF4430 domain-containing protein [Clostridia bacterium]
MKQTESKKILSLLLVVMLCAAIALTGCSDTHSSALPSESPDKVTVVGEGGTTFSFIVIDPENRERHYEVHTDKTVVGDALSELGLIEGEMGQYGLYVHKVAGIEVDFERDGKYWAFYVNGEYAMSGVDTTEIMAGETYMFKAQA